MKGTGVNHETLIAIPVRMLDLSLCIVTLRRPGWVLLYNKCTGMLNSVNCLFSVRLVLI